MNIIIKLKTFLWVGFCVSGCFLSSCIDDEGNVGLELQNPEDRVAVFNDSTSQINTYTYQQADSIYLSPGYLLLGYNNDKILGAFQNNFMTEVSLSSFNVDFGEEPVADAMVLYLDYNYSYGDTTQMQTISIYELKTERSLNDSSKTINARPMDSTVVSEYYNATEPLTTFSFYPNPADTLPIKIILPDSFKDRFLDTSYYSTQDIFSDSVFRGFYFVAKPIAEGGAISYFNTGDSTRMELQYHDDTVAKTYTYSIDSYSYRCNIFYRTTHPEIKSIATRTAADTSFEQELFYIKNNNTFEANINISGLNTWMDSGYFTINKALITIYEDEPSDLSDSINYHHSSLQVLKVDSTYKKTYLEEYITNTGYSPIYPQMLDDGSYFYQININKTLYNAIIAGEDNLNLVIAADEATNRATANRTILRGAKHLETPLKLKLTYTKFNAE